jgi:hypothetical protein
MFPTKQGYANRLKNVEHLWWVDHATAGISGWGTLDWFSSKAVNHTIACATAEEAAALASRRVKYKAKVVQAQDGKYAVKWKGPSEAVTHFVVFPDGTPFMLLPLCDGAWGEPKRNGDAIQIETVNALAVHCKEGQWRYWAGPIPPHIMIAQPPVLLGEPYRGAMHMQPYTKAQVLTNILLKRVCAIATGRMALERMSQHADWRASKSDMGPLWPRSFCDTAAFERFPVESYQPEHAGLLYDVKDTAHPDKEVGGGHEDSAAPLAGAADDTNDSVKEVQTALIALYGEHSLAHGADGSLGPETVRGVKRFQSNWNLLSSDDPIRVDGIPGEETCKRLQKALAMGARFIAK